MKILLKYLSVYLWVLLVFSTGFVSGQERDAVPFVVADTLHLATDTLHLVTDTLKKPPAKGVFPADTLLMPRDTLLADSLSLLSARGKPPLDSIPSLPDSLRRRVVLRQTDLLDTLSNRLFAYQVLPRNSFARSQIAIDTTLIRFDINNPVMRNYHAGAYLGNLGLPYYPIGFNARKRPSDFLFLDHLSDYLHDPEATIYYQTKSPYTHIDYSSAGTKQQNESVFKLVHSQNINKNWNAGLYYDIINSIGQYINQSTSNNGFSLFSAYRGSQYSMYTNFNWNNVRMKENGGLKDVGNYLINKDEAVRNSVRSDVGKTILLNRSFYLMHSYSPVQLTLPWQKQADTDSVNVSRFTFVHTLKYDWSTREHSDTATYALQGKEPYFGRNAQRRVETRDSLHYRRISNHFELMIKEQSRRKFTAGFSAGLLTEIDRMNANMIPDTVNKYVRPNETQNPVWGGDLPDIYGTEQSIFYRKTKTHFNTAITGRFFNHTGRYLNWDINGKFYFTGYKLGDLNINGNVRIHYDSSKGRSTLLLGGSIENAQPGYFLKEYASNVLAWDNNFNPSQEIRLRGEFMMPHRTLKLGAYLSQLNNYIYINTDAIPEQTSEPLVTGTAYVEKDIRWWKLGFRFRLYGQYSTNQSIIPLPAFAGFQSTYFEGWLEKNVLNMQLGWNVVFNTKYYAYAYMPASGMFYLQEEQQIGNYPFFDFFLNFQIKRARFFIKTDGLNTVFSSMLGKENFMVYRYPTNDFRMKFGVSWAFYD